VYASIFEEGVNNKGGKTMSRKKGNKEKKEKKSQGVGGIVSEGNGKDERRKIQKGKEGRG